MLKRVLVVLLFCWPAWALAQPTCVLLWDAPTTYEDGSPLTAAIDLYRIYQYPPDGSPSSTNYLEVPGVQTSAALSCPGWSRAVATALLCLDITIKSTCSESTYSNDVLLKKTSGPPRNARQGG